MRNFRLLTDMDDVMENLVEVWLKKLNDLYCTNPNFIPKKGNELKTYDILSEFPMLTLEQVFAPLNLVDFWKDVKPLKDAAEILKKYNNMENVDVRILTSSHYTAISPKREFLREYFPFLKWEQVIVCKEKKYVKGDVLIDDYEGNLPEDADYKGILLTYPRNKNVECDGERLFRANNWKEIDVILDGMIKEHFKGEN